MHRINNLKILATIRVLKLIDMKSNNFNKPPVDHYIQADILQKLYISDNSIAFSDLKPNEIENSLFMYHLRKLLSSGIVVKDVHGYNLTPKGVRWINYIGGRGLQFNLSPILLTQFIAVSDNKILLASRRGAASNVLHKYLLPGGRHVYGELAETSLKMNLDEIGLITSSHELLTILETIIVSPDDYSHHTIAHIFKVELNESQEITTDKYHYSWHLIEDVSNNHETYGKLLSWLIDKYSKGKLQQSESYWLEQ